MDRVSISIRQFAGRQTVAGQLDRRTLIAGAGATALTSAAKEHTTVAEAANRPNVLLIFMDDQTYRSIGSLNNPEAHTPNLDRLVKCGTTFTHAFNQGSWSGAVCIP